VHGQCRELTAIRTNRPLSGCIRTVTIVLFCEGCLRRFYRSIFVVLSSYERWSLSARLVNPAVPQVGNPHGILEDTAIQDNAHRFCAIGAFRRMAEPQINVPCQNMDPGFDASRLGGGRTTPVLRTCNLLGCKVDASLKIPCPDCYMGDGIPSIDACVWQDSVKLLGATSTKEIP